MATKQTCELASSHDIKYKVVFRTKTKQGLKIKVKMYVKAIYPDDVNTLQLPFSVMRWGNQK